MIMDIIDIIRTRPEFVLAKRYIEQVKLLNKKTKNNIRIIYNQIYGNIHSEKCVKHTVKYTREFIIKSENSNDNSIVNLYELLTHSLNKCGCTS
jgi:hypothetical protein